MQVIADSSQDSSLVKFSIGTHTFGVWWHCSKSLLRKHRDIQPSYSVLILGNRKVTVGSDWASLFCYTRGNFLLCFNNYFKKIKTLLWFSDDLPDKLYWSNNAMTRISSGYYSANGSLKAAPLLSKHFRKSEAQTQDKFSFSESQTA